MILRAGLQRGQMTGVALLGLVERIGIKDRAGKISFGDIRFV